MMSLAGATVLFMMPGRATLRIELSGLWPLWLAAALSVPLSMGIAARHGWEAMHASDSPRMMRAAQLAGSLNRVQPSRRPSAMQHRRPQPSPARAELRPATPRVAARASAVGPVALAARAPRAPALRDGAAAISAAPILRAFRGRPGWEREGELGDADGSSTVLRLHALRLGEAVRVQPFDASGAPQAEAFAALSQLMRCRVTGEQIAIDPRLVRILTQLADDYGRPIQLISGHRAPHANGTSPTSQHTTGRAADIRIAGVPIEDLQRRAIELGANGVGLYPEKGFVHVDVRPRPRAYWLYTQASGEQLFDRLAPLPNADSSSEAPSEPEHADGEHTTGEHADDE